MLSNLPSHSMQTKSIYNSKQDQTFSCQSSRKLISSAVKTPALLFYKPTSNTAQKTKYQQNHTYNTQCTKLQSNNSTKTLQILCENHPKIYANFVSVTDQQGEQYFYCDKCANLLREQGFTILPINSYNYHKNTRKSQISKNSNDSIKKNQFRSSINYPYPQRQHQINDFLNNLASARQQLNQNSTQIRQILINSQQFYGEQIQQINQYFQTIIQSLELQKNKCYNHILQQRQNAQKQVRNLGNKLAESQKQINSMVIDIQENLDSVYSISWQNYKLVMETFHGRMSQVSKLLDQIKDKGIIDVQYRKIQFAGVPQSINSLSQIIIQNSYGSVQDPDGSLLLTQGSNTGSFQRRQLPDNAINKIRDQSIFQKLRTEQSQDSSIHINNASHLVFSFDGERMRQANNSQYQQYKENIYNPMNVNMNKHFNQDNDENFIKLRKNRSYNDKLQNQCIQRVEGIKQVEELDVLIVDDQLLDSSSFQGSRSNRSSSFLH